MRNPLQLAFDWFTGAQEGACAPPQRPTGTDSEKNPRNPSANRSGDAMEKIVDTAYDYADCAEHREGIEAFLAKRRPLF